MRSSRSTSGWPEAMCGIAGQISYEAPPDERRVAALTRALAHRGPDGEGVVRLGAACLGHRRLALLDRAGGGQPYTSPDGRYALVFNGEIDNAEALRLHYADRWTFRSRSDTEVLLAALVVDGEEALLRLHGMFALCWWDAQREVGLCARDRLGVRPLVYTTAGGRLTFASEAKALVRTGVLPARVDVLAVAEYLCAAPFSGVERAPFSGVQILPPGSLLRISQHGVEQRVYYTPRPRAERDDVPALVDELRRELDDAVAGALISDEPVGVFLSGGLDSSLLAAIARRHGVTLPAFTVGFPEQASFDWSASRIVLADDEPYAAEVARALALPRTRCVRSGSLAASIARVAITNDLLPAWEQELSQDLLAREAARTVKAVLVGDAADETHYGYHFLFDEGALRGPEHILPRFGVAPLRRDVLPDPVSHFGAAYRAQAEAAGYGWGSREERQLATSHLVLTRWLPRLLSNGDLHAMAHGLEARVPFAHPPLVELALRIRPEAALAGGVEKALLREVAQGLVPAAVVARRKSALPKDLACEPAYRIELPLALERAPELLGAVLDLGAVRELAARPWGEPERAVAFRIIALSMWAAHHEVSS